MVFFKVGSYVMALDSLRDYKLAPRYEGPFKVVRRNRGGAYVFMDHDNTLLHRNYAPNLNQLISVPTPTIPASDNDVFNVERILNHRYRNNRLEYLIKWRDFPGVNNTWEPEANILDPLSITIYWKQPRPAP